MTQESNGEISLYTGESAKKEDIVSEVKKLTAAFPDITNDYIAMLVDRLKVNGFTKQRTIDAIGYTIDTCIYPVPKIAEIISFDRKVKTYSYTEMTAMCNQYRTSENFEMVDLNGPTKRWIEK